MTWFSPPLAQDEYRHLEQCTVLKISYFHRGETPMKSHSYLIILGLLALLLASGSILASDRPDQPGRSPAQPVDDDYTRKILEYTTKPYFKSPLVDYLPASPTVPTPRAGLGDIAGAPGKLPYSAEVYKYMRMLEKATPRVKVYSIGTTEEGKIGRAHV